MSTTLRVMTMNLASGSGESYVDFTVQAHARFINQIGPDVVFLQEVDRRTRRANGTDQLAVLRDSTPLSNSHFVKWQNFQGGEAGIAIISRLPLENAHNVSVYANWFTWFMVKIVTPVAYAEIDVVGRKLRLYATHFPSNDEGGKRYGAEVIAARLPPSGSTVLGGDFNDGPGSDLMKGIDAKLRPTEGIATHKIDQDHRGLDHLYVSRDITCDLWARVPATEGPRGRFSDHPIVYSDLLVPTSTSFKTTVPDVREMKAANAASAIRAASLEPQFSGATGSGAWVAAQSPRSGAIVDSGTTVTLQLRMGPIL